METRASVAEAVFAGGELTEVLGGLRDYIVVELEDDATSGLVVNADVELGALTRRTGRSSSIAGNEGRQLQLRPHILGCILTKTLLMVKRVVRKGEGEESGTRSLETPFKTGAAVADQTQIRADQPEKGSIT